MGIIVHKFIKLFVAFLILSIASLSAHAKTLNFYSSSGSLRPFYWHDGQSQRGIIPDIFASLEGYDLEFVNAPRKRIDPFIEQGRLDVIMIHPSYTQADQYLNFVPLHFNQENVLFSLAIKRNSYDTIDTINNASICARDGYVYVNMKDRWKNQHLRRENLRSNVKLLKMLHLERCDYAIGSRLSIRYLLNQAQITTIFETQIRVNSLPRFLAISKKFPELKEKLKHHIIKLRDNGELEAILRKYAP